MNPADELVCTEPNFGTPVALNKGMRAIHRFKGVKVFKHFTTVFASLLVLILSASIALAEPGAESEPDKIEEVDKPRSSTTLQTTPASDNRVKSHAQVCQEMAGGDMAKFRECMGDNSDNTDQAQCRSAKSTYLSVRNEFARSCGPGGFTNNGGERGHIACSKQVACCTKNAGASDCGPESGNPRSDDYQNLSNQLAEFQEQLSGLAGANSSQVSSLQRQINTTRLQQSYMMCPANAQANLPVAQEDADAAREKLEEKQEKLAELQEELQLAQIEKEEKINEIQNEIKNEELTTQNALDEIEADLEARQKDIANRIKELQESIATANADKDRITEARKTAEREKTQAEDELYLGCLRRSEEKVTQKRQACVNAALSASALALQAASGGGQGARQVQNNGANPNAGRQGCSKTTKEIFAAQGITTLELMQREVAIEIQICRKDPEYRRTYARIQKTHRDALESYDNQNKAIDGQIQRLIQEITEMRTEDMSESLRANIKALERLNSRHAAEMDRLRRQGITEEKRADAKIASINRKIQLYMEHVRNAEEGLAAKQAYLAAAQGSGGGQSGISQENYQATLGKYNELVQATNTFTSACCNAETNDTECGNAEAFAGTHSRYNVNGRSTANEDRGTVTDSFNVD